MTPWTIACQAPISMGFPRQEYWGRLPFPSPGDLPEPEIKPGSPALQADLYCLSHRGQSCPMTEPLSHQGNTFISLSVKSPKPLFRDFLVCFLNSFSSQLKNIKHTHTHTHTHIHTQCQRKILKGWIYPPLSRILVPQVLTASITLHLNFDPYCTVTCSEVLLGSSLATALCWILNLPAKAKNW